MVRASDFRDGDVVEVRPMGWKDSFQPFQGVVDSRGHKGMKSLRWVFVRKFGTNYAGGWYPNQCRRIGRLVSDPTLHIPDNVVLGEN